MRGGKRKQEEGTDVQKRQKMISTFERLKVDGSQSEEQDFMQIEPDKYRVFVPSLDEDSGEEGGSESERRMGLSFWGDIEKKIAKVPPYILRADSPADDKRALVVYRSPDSFYRVDNKPICLPSSPAAATFPAMQPTAPPNSPTMQPADADDIAMQDL